MSQYLIQMSGVPGSGKSTIANAISPHVDAIVIDHDSVKSAVLRKNIANDLAGQASYEVVKELTDDFLAQGYNVIIDSPCLYSELLEFGDCMVRKYGVTYRYIECRINDVHILQERIVSRKAKPSQTKVGPMEGSISHRGNPPRESSIVFAEWAEQMKRPAQYLTIDTLSDQSECVAMTLEYIRSGDT